MIELGVWDIIRPMVMDSLCAANLIRDNTFDLVFLDADHRYHPFCNDIRIWLRKITTGGILCGHDCDILYDNLSFEQRQKVDSSPYADVILGVGHPGVIRGLHDCLPSRHNLIEGTRIWWHQK